MATSTAKRKRKARRVDTDGDPEFQVAPMVDVLLVLMLFFMAITSTEVLQKDKNLTLPEANNAKADKKKHTEQLVVNVEWKNGAAIFSMNGVTYPNADALQGPIGAKRARDPRTYVLIRADKDVEYSNISDLMNTCAQAGVATVSFATIINPNDHPAAADNGGGS
jgi:biopolymer transport protein ExbD